MSTDPKEVFLEAAELGEAERPAYLDRACGGDAALRARVEALLAAAAAAGTFLASPAGACEADEARDLAGAQVGHFKLYEQRFGKDHIETGRTHCSFGLTLMRLRRFAEAETELLAAESVIRTAKEATAEDRSSCFGTLIELYESWNQAEPGKGYDAKAAQWKKLAQEGK